MLFNHRDFLSSVYVSVLFNFKKLLCVSNKCRVQNTFGMFRINKCRVQNTFGMF